MEFTKSDFKNYFYMSGEIMFENYDWNGTAMTAFEE